MQKARLLALATLAAAVAACGTPTVTSTPDDTAANEAAISAPSETPTAKKAAKPAGIGDIITLADNTGEVKIAVKVTRIINNGTAANDLVKPKSGQRLYGVEIVMKNTGSGVLDDSPGNGAKVVDDEGQEYEHSLFGEIAGEHNMGSVTLAPGKVRKGVLVFEVPKKAKITEFLMALSSGYADQKGSWTLG